VDSVSVELPVQQPLVMSGNEDFPTDEELTGDENIAKDESIHELLKGSKRDHSSPPTIDDDSKKEH